MNHMQQVNQKGALLATTTTATASSQAKSAGKTPPKMVDIGKTSRTGTRATPDVSANAQGGKTREALYGAGGMDWKSQGTTGARAWLIAKAFISEDCDPNPSLAMLALVLLRVAATGTASVMAEEALRAVAFLLEERKTDAVFDLIETLDGVVTDVQKVLAYAESSSAGPGGVNNDMRSAAEMLTRAVEEQSVELYTLTERLGNGLAEALERAETAPVAAIPAGLAPSGAMRGESRGTYANAAATGGVPPRHASALANAHARERQIMVDRSPLVDTYGLAKLSEKELVEKANLALDLAKTALGDNTVPDAAAFVGARRLRSGAVVFHLTTAGAAEW
ncbi:hypothetical protein B0H11DRAFT_1943943 [Mycena galericulata]|nr:hypothetical protein B0H11DRAFT_1943943 [Mycena galericulata]